MGICHLLLLSVAAAAQPASVTPTPPAPASSASLPQSTVPGRGQALSTNTPVRLVSLEEVTSNGLRVGTGVRFSVAEDIVHGGVIVIPRGSPATGTITWKTGKAIGGKSGKFDVAFQEVVVNGNRYRLMGKHRQEGRGNTLGAVLGSMVISGRSAVLMPGQEVQALTAEPIPF